MNHNPAVYEDLPDGRIRCLICHKTMAQRGWFLHELRAREHRGMLAQGLLFPPKRATRGQSVSSRSET